MKLLKDLLKYSLGFIIIFFVYTFKPFLKIRFGILYAERIGHLANTFDNYIYSRNSRGKFELAIFHVNSSISNKELHRLWKISQKKIFFSNLAKIIIHSSKKFKIGKKLIINWDEMETIPKKSNTKEKYITFDKKFFEQGQNILKRNNIKEPFICFTSRDDAYLDKKFDKNYHDFIDFDFNNFHQSINFLINNGNSVIRITKKTSIEYKNPSKNYFFLTDSRTDHSDIFFLTQSKYNVFGSYHGITNLSGICRKKSLYLNYIPFHLGSLTTMSKFSVFIPKKIYCKKNNRLLKFFEINDLINLKYNIHYPGNFFQDNNLEVIDNTEMEVYNTIKEFDENYDRAYTGSISNLQNRFWNSFSNSNEIKFLRDELCISISEIFLENNKDLI